MATSGEVLSHRNLHVRDVKIKDFMNYIMNSCGCIRVLSATLILDVENKVK